MLNKVTMMHSSFIFLFSPLLIVEKCFECFWACCVIWRPSGVQMASKWRPNGAQRAPICRWYGAEWFVWVVLLHWECLGWTLVCFVMIDCEFEFCNGKLCSLEGSWFLIQRILLIVVIVGKLVLLSCCPSKVSNHYGVAWPSCFSLR